MWNARYGAEIVKRLDSFITKSNDGISAKNSAKLSQVYSSYDIVRKTTLGLFRSFGYREADFYGIHGSELNSFIKMGMFTRLMFHLDPGCPLWPEQLLKITEHNNEILLIYSTQLPVPSSCDDNAFTVRIGRTLIIRTNTIQMILLSD